MVPGAPRCQSCPDTLPGGVPDTSQPQASTRHLSAAKTLRFSLWIYSKAPLPACLYILQPSLATACKISCCRLLPGTVTCPFQQGEPGGLGPGLGPGPSSALCRLPERRPQCCAGTAPQQRHWRGAGSPSKASFHSRWNCSYCK